MDFTLTCPAPRERVCDSGQREAAGSKSGFVTDRARLLLRLCTRLTWKGPLNEALGQLEWPVGGPRGLHWSPQVPQTPSQPSVPPQAGLLQQLPRLQTQWVTRPAKAVLPYWRP